MSHFVEPDLILHCLQMSNKMDAMLICMPSLKNVCCHSTHNFPGG